MAQTTSWKVKGGVSGLALAIRMEAQVKVKKVSGRSPPENMICCRELWKVRQRGKGVLEKSPCEISYAKLPTTRLQYLCYSRESMLTTIEVFSQ